MSVASRLLLAVLSALASIAADAEPVSAGVTTLVSASSAGVQGDNHSISGQISENGRYVVFGSSSITLAPNDTDGTNDVFVRDLETRTTTLVSVSSLGVKGNGGSRAGAISGDGRYVVFDSNAANLVPSDTNGQRDVFVHDRATGTTERVTVTSSGAQANGESFALEHSVSADGRLVVFYSHATNLAEKDENGTFDVFVRDRGAGTTTLVSASKPGEAGDGASLTPHLSADGRFVVFASHATDLVKEDENEEIIDVFVRDLETETTSLVSVSSAGVQGNSTSYIPAISADGRFAAFTSFASNLVGGDTNGAYDVFVRDLQRGTTERVSVSSTGGQGENPPDVGIPPDSSHPYLSADGRFVAFRSLASTLVPGDTNYRSTQGSMVADAFVRDRVGGTTVRASVSTAGEQANGTSLHVSVSADGRRVVFDSDATNLVPADVNGVRFDVFLREMDVLALAAGT